MNTKISRFISVILALVMAVSVCLPLTAFAVNENDAGNFISQVTDVDGKYSEDVRSDSSKWFYNLLDKLMMGLVKLIGSTFAVPDSWVNEDEHVSENFLAGTKTFLDEPAQGAVWSLGYSNASLLDGQDVLDNEHYVAGSISFENKYATEVFDDLRCRTIAINDGSGRGTAVFVALDAYAISNPLARQIRAALADFAEQNNVVSITVTVLHQHSAIDTFGMNGNIYEMAFLNPWRTLFGAEDKVVNGTNDEYMENLVNVSVDTVKAAVANLETGTLGYTKSDMSDYHIDKRDPQVNDTNFNVFVFNPDNAQSADTYIVESIIHCVSFGASTTSVSGDYPYYLEKELNANDNNMFMFMGAQQSTTLNRSEELPIIETDMSTVERVEAIGKDMADRIMRDAAAMTVEVNPLLNIKSEEITLDITNSILELAGKAGIFKESIVKTGFNSYAAVTEIAYMELGDNFAFTLVPGELAPELAYGGTLPASVSWNGTDFEYPSLQDMVGDRKLIPMGLCNDEIGYIVPDNNYMPVLVEESDSIEFVSLGNKTASTLMTDFRQLIDSVK